MKRIDFENHFYDQSLIDALTARTEPPYYRRETDLITWSDSITMPQGILLKRLLDVDGGRLALMDQLGIDCAVLSCSPGAEQLDTDESVRICRATNDALHALTRKYPGRYLGSAILPVKDVPAAMSELERCVRDLGFVAWHTHSNYGATSPDDPRYRPLFKKAAELGVYVYLHPQLANASRVDDCGFPVAGPGLGFTMDTITTLTRMIVGGLFDEIPNLNLMLGHLGEALPFLLERMDNRLKFLPNAKAKNKRDFSYYFHHNIYVTTSGNMSPEAFECTRRVLGQDRILFGSDYPFENAGDMVKFVDQLPLTEEERQALYEDNAKKLGVRAESC